MPKLDSNNITNLLAMVQLALVMLDKFGVKLPPGTENLFMEFAFMAVLFFTGQPSKMTKRLSAAVTESSFVAYSDGTTEPNTMNQPMM